MMAVTEIGMVSALGLDVVTSCAAARAGIRRITEVDDLYVPDLDGEEAAPVAVHRASRVTSGLFGFTRLLQLGLTGLDDLLSRGDLATDNGPVAMILLLRNAAYEHAWSCRQADDEGAEVYESFRVARDKLMQELLPALVERAELPIAPQLRATLPSTAVGFIAALQQAEKWLESGACKRCIVGGIDSLIEPTTLLALDGLGLLRTPERPVGMIPGEAACFLLLERSRHSQRASVKALLDGAGLAHETGHPVLDDKSTEGNGVRAAISQALGRQPDGGQSTALTVVNLNGEPYRATSWWRGLIATSTPRLSELTSWYPPLFFGEIGAATGPVSVALLSHGWARRHAPSSNALVCLLDDLGARGAVCVRPPELTP